MAQGYGGGMWCTDQIRSGRRATHRQVVAHALYRRLITPRGTLRGSEQAAAYGFDVSGYVGAVGTALSLRALPDQVRAELLKDDRVSSVSVSAALSTNSAGETSIVLDIVATLADESGDFSFTLAANAGGSSVCPSEIPTILGVWFGGRGGGSTSTITTSIEQKSRGRTPRDIPDPQRRPRGGV